MDSMHQSSSDIVVVPRYLHRCMVMMPVYRLFDPSGDGRSAQKKSSNGGSEQPSMMCGLGSISSDLIISFTHFTSDD